ncbi:hypothetical protein NPIL_535761 [Nephila pilipes]|uniref:Uncharacterized protein n=1 Tax=Nephila pilipes TaxID=299642 RepID=A0A8X6THS3_NEPPI|nr:hypothetical protein NPIL_535761 [Nephila pilipes]
MMYDPVRLRVQRVCLLRDSCSVSDSVLHGPSAPSILYSQGIATSATWNLRQLACEFIQTGLQRLSSKTTPKVKKALLTSQRDVYSA